MIILSRGSSLSFSLVLKVPRIHPASCLYCITKLVICTRKDPLLLNFNAPLTCCILLGDPNLSRVCMLLIFRFWYPKAWKFPALNCILLSSSHLYIAALYPTFVASEVARVFNCLSTLVSSALLARMDM